MIQTYNILSLLLDYPTAELWNSREEVLPALTAEGVLSVKALGSVRSFLDYVATFADARSWQAAYSDLFDSSTKTNLYLFDMVYGTSRDRWAGYGRLEGGISACRTHASRRRAARLPSDVFAVCRQYGQ